MYGGQMKINQNFFEKTAKNSRSSALTISGDGKA
jgi:hypothetical protein